MANKNSFIHVLYTKSKSSKIYDRPTASFGRRQLYGITQSYLITKLGRKYFSENFTHKQIRDFEYDGSSITKFDGQLIDHNPDPLEVHQTFKEIKSK